MKQLCSLISKYFGVVIILFFLGGMLCPPAFTWVLGKFLGFSLLSFMLGVIMFGMGTTMELKDFVLILQRPRDVFLGAVAQFAVMPFLAYVLCHAFDLGPALTAGVVLVGTCPGGTSSNVITYMSRGDVALSVTMTMVSTVLSPFLTPLITYWIIGQQINFSPVGMFFSIIQIVIVPIALGLAVKKFLPKLAETAEDYLPAVSSLAISLIIAGVIAVSRNAILAASSIIILVVILHNCLGYALGFAIAHVAGLTWKKAVALSIEVGMQNSGLAAGLAKAHFPGLPAATVPGAIFSCWHNISGSILAWLFVNYLNPRFDPETQDETLPQTVAVHPAD